MPLELLAIMVVLGLAIAIGAVHFSGLSHAALIEGQVQAESRFAEDFPDSTIKDCLITSDKRSAFLQLEGRAVGLVTAMGDRYITRRVDAAVLAGVELQGEAGLALHFHDFTYPAGSYAFAGKGERERLAGWLEEMKP